MLLKNNVMVKMEHNRNDVPLMQNALKSGKVDGYVAWEPYISQERLMEPVSC